MKSLHRWPLLLLVFVVCLRPALAEIERTQETLNLDYSAEKRVTIMWNVADKFELNLVVPDSLPNEKIDLKLRDVTGLQALEACVRGTGFACLPRDNMVWLVRPDSTLGSFFQLRDQLDRATEGTYELRAIIGRLTRGETRPVTKEQSAQAQAFLDDPASSPSDLLQKLGPEPSQSPPAVESSVRESDTLSVDFPNETCAGILREVAGLFELKLVVPPDFQDRKMSIKLRDVSWRRIFEVCLLGSDYIYVARGDSVRLVRADEMLGEFGQMRVQLDRDTKDSRDLREVIAFLTRPEARALTPVQRGQITAFLANPESSAFDLLQKLGADQEKTTPAPAR